MTSGADSTPDHLAQQADPADLKPGISVIIPSFSGRDRIASCLSSFAHQTLDPAQFEVIIVLNGPDDGTGTVVERFSGHHPGLDILVVQSPDVGTSQARNVGIATATRRHTTFVDDDDSVSPGYLRTMLAHARPGIVPFAQIVNVDGAGRIDPANSINMQTIRYTGQVVHPEHVPRAVGFNACKLLPTHMVKQIEYDPALHSGVDVVFFMTLLAHFDFSIYVCPVESGPDAQNAVYYRLMRPESMSRREISFEFNVVGRLEVMSRLQALAALCDDRRLRVLQMTMSGQASFINRYIAAHPVDVGRVLAAIETYGLTSFPYHRLTSGLAKSLVVYCDATERSAATKAAMARRVRERGEVVDLVRNVIGSAEVDPATALIRGLVDRDVRLEAPLRSNDWSSVAAFCEKGIQQLETGARAKAGYQRLFSVGTSPASHILAAAYKLRHPDVAWTAELTDQQMRPSNWLRRRLLTPVPLLQDLSAGLTARGMPIPDTMDVPHWSEYLALTLADELLFPDEILMESMLRRHDVADVPARVRPGG